jgi:hypothetical protein
VKNLRRSKNDLTIAQQRLSTALCVLVVTTTLYGGASKAIGADEMTVEVPPLATGRTYIPENPKQFARLLRSSESEAPAIVADLKELSRKNPSIVGQASENVQDKSLKPHIRVALIELIIVADPFPEASLNILIEIMADRSNSDKLRIYSIEGLRQHVPRKKIAIDSITAVTTAIAQDKTEGLELRAHATALAFIVNGQSTDVQSLLRRILRDSTENVKLRKSVVSSFEIIAVLDDQKTKSITFMLLNIGADSKSPSDLRIAALDSSTSVAESTGLLRVSEDGRVAMLRSAVSLLANEHEMLEIRLAAGKLLCADGLSDKSVVPMLILVLESEHADLQEIGAEIVRKIGPEAKSLRPYLVKIRDHRNTTKSLRQTVDAALLSLDRTNCTGIER